MNEQAQPAARALVASLEEYVSVCAAQQERLDEVRGRSRSIHDWVMRRLTGDGPTGAEAGGAAGSLPPGIGPDRGEASRQDYLSEASLGGRQATALCDADRALLQLAAFSELQPETLAIHERIRGIRLLATEAAPTEVYQKMADSTLFPPEAAGELQSLSPEARKERMRAMAIPFLASMDERQREVQDYYDVQVRRQEQYLEEALEMARRILTRTEGCGSDAS